MVENRKAMVRAVRFGVRVKDVARIFMVSRKTIWKWHKRVSKRGQPHRTYPKVNP
jgi:transposase